jgi:predicted nucleotidyltransferase
VLGRLQKSELTGDALKQEVETIQSLILSRCAHPPLAIVLFGSAVTDSLTAASDLDLAAIFESSEQAELAREQILRPGPLSAWPVDLLLVSAREFQQKLLLGGVYAKVRRGKVLYPDHFNWESSL